MADFMYAKGLEGFLDGSIDWDTHNIKAVLVDTGAYTPNQSTDDNLDDIPGGARIATSGNLASKTVTNGVADAADTTISSVSGTSIEAIVLYKDTGTESTSRLICKIDSYAGLPYTPSGADVTIQWPSGSDRIFKL